MEVVLSKSIHFTVTLDKEKLKKMIIVIVADKFFAQLIN